MQGNMEVQLREMSMKSSKSFLKIAYLTIQMTW